MTFKKGGATEATTDVDLSSIERATTRLFWYWMLVLLVALLGLLSITVVLVQRHAQQAIEPELRVTTQEVARGLQNELDRALALGIPFEQLGGVAVWLDESLKTQPVLKGIALISTQGQVLHHAGEAEEVWQAWASERAHQFASKSSTAETVDRGPLGEVATAVALHAPISTSTLAYLVVTGYIPPAPRIFWFIWGGALALTWVLAGVWLRYRLWRDVNMPLRALDADFSSLAQQRLLMSPFRQVRPVILHQIHHHWAGQLHRTQARWQALLDKIAEVKASHFDLLVLQRLDQLAATASAWRFSPDVDNPKSLSAEKLSIKRASTFSLWRLWQQRTLPVQMFIGVSFALLCLMVLAWGWQTQLQTQQTRQILQHQESLVQLSWQNAINSQHTRLNSMIDTWHHEQTNRDIWIQELASDHDDSSADAAPVHVNKMQVLLQMAEAHLSVLDARGTLIATSAHKPIRPYPSSALVMTQWPTHMPERRTESPLSRVFGIWQGQDRSFQLGWIQRMEDAQGVWVLTLSNDLNAALDELAQKLNAPVAMADLRGQVIGSDAHGLVSSWRAHQRQSHATFLPNKEQTPFHVLAVPLISLSGHTSATLLVAFEATPVTWFPSGMSYVMAGLMCVVCGFLCWGLLAMLRFVSKIGQRMQHLAQMQPQEKSFDIEEEDGSLSSLHLPSLLLTTENLRQRINDFTVLRRSRERQGRRQARFIRHQMMALAQRLNEDARQGILDDLARIESASKSHHFAHSGRGRGTVPLESMVDEISVLALGFQNLVHRVGDQYQQLAQLVQELREALRVKTQYIAIQQELEIARKMQLAILPQAFAQTNGFSIDARMLPAKEIGGDFYDFFPLDAHRVAIAVADVSGKGIPAAFFMAVSRTLLRAVAPFDPSPAVCLSRLNNLLAADNPEMMFVTLFYAVLDTRTGHIQYGSAGHNPPYLIRHRSNVPIEIPSLGNMALAVMEDMPYDQADFVLEPGDRLFLYTDGVTEAMSPEQELYGEERLMLLLTEFQHTPAALVPDLVLDVLHAFEGDGAQADDITTLVVHHTQASPT